MLTEDVSYPSGTFEDVQRAASLTATFSVDIDSSLGRELSRTCRLRVAITSSENVDEHVFVVENVPDSAGREADQYRFVHVATVCDMQELPIELPAEGSEYRCRRSTVDLYFRTHAELEDGKSKIRRRLRELCEDIDRLGRGLAYDQAVTWTFLTDETYGSSQAA